MVIKAAASLVLGAVLLLFPGVMLDLAGVPSSLGSSIFARMYGAACIGICMLMWFARNAEDSTARRAIILDGCGYDGIGFFALLAIQLSSGLNAFGWLPIMLYLFFAVSFGYYLVPLRKPAQAPKSL